MKTRISMYRLGGKLALDLRVRVAHLRWVKLLLMIPLL